jgi:hypothetical protein
MVPMRKLIIPIALKQEFATVEALWNSRGATRRVDALVISSVKYEKQLSRLFCFLVYQHPKVSSDNVDAVIAVLVQNRDLYPETFIKGIKELGVVSVQ